MTKWQEENPENGFKVSQHWDYDRICELAIVMTIAEVMKFESCKAFKVFGQWVRFFSKNIA